MISREYAILPYIFYPYFDRLTNILFLSEMIL